MTAKTTPSGVANVVVAAGVLFVNEQQQIMLVKPTYKPGWELPGGHVESGESPYAACVREVGEELGIRPAIGELLVIDWAPRQQQGDKLLFVFNGNELSTQQRDSIRLPESELSEYRYVPEADIPRLTIPRLARRIRQAQQARSAGHTFYLEHGIPQP